MNHFVVLELTPNADFKPQQAPSHAGPSYAASPTLRTHPPGLLRRAGPGRLVAPARVSLPEVRHALRESYRREPDPSPAPGPTGRTHTIAARCRSGARAALPLHRGPAHQRGAGLWPSPALEGRHDPGRRCHPGPPRDMGVGLRAPARSQTTVADSIQRTVQHQPGRCIAGTIGGGVSAHSDAQNGDKHAGN